MLIDVIGTTPSREASSRWEERFGERVRDSFLTSPGGRRCSRLTRYRLAEFSVRHPAVGTGANIEESDRREELEYPAFLDFWQFDDGTSFQAWEQSKEAGRWGDLAEEVGGVRCLFRAQYEALPYVLERGPRTAAPGFKFINLVGTFTADPSDPTQIDAWKRVYCEYMTHGVFGEHPQIKRLARFIRSTNTVDGLSDRAPELIPPMLTTYDFDSWDDFLAYHHQAHDTETGRRNRAQRLAWAEALAGVKAPASGRLLYRAQYEAIETITRTAVAAR
jgi:hypothetical protein